MRREARHAAVLTGVAMALLVPGVSAQLPQGLHSELAVTSVSVVDDSRRIRAGIGRTRLVQGAAVREATSVTASTTAQMGTDDVSFDLGVSAWREGPTRVGAFVDARWSDGGTTFSARASHGPVWRRTVGTDPLGGLRIVDLRLLDRGLTASEVRATAAFPVLGESSLDLETGGTLYSDGNRRLFASARKALPLRRHGAVQIDIAPSVYYETFSNATIGFLTHRTFASAGVGMQLNARWQSLNLDAVVDPLVFHRAGEIQAGFNTRVASSLRVGRATLLVSGQLMRLAAHGSSQLAFELSLATE